MTFSNPGRIAVVDMRRDIEEMALILDHPLQRRSQQWSLEQKSNLIRRILHGGELLPLIICTQRDNNGCNMAYLIDGVQRVTTICEFMMDVFAISKNTRDAKVSYAGILYQTKNTKSGNLL